MKLKSRIIIYIAVAVTVLILGILAVLSSSQSAAEKADKFIDLGNKYLLELSYDKAVIEFEKAIEIEPKNADAYIGLAEAYEGIGDKEKAREVLELGYERTGDERIKEMLDELLGAADETAVTTTVATTTEETTALTEFAEMTTVKKNVMKDNIEITDVVCTDPESFLFEVTVKYDLYSFSKGEINVGFPKKGKSGYHILTRYIIDEGTGEITLNVTASSDYDFNKCWANLSEYPHEHSWSPIMHTSIDVTNIPDMITMSEITTAPETTTTSEAQTEKTTAETIEQGRFAVDFAEMTMQKIADIYDNNVILEQGQYGNYAMFVPEINSMFFPEESVYDENNFNFDSKVKMAEIQMGGNIMEGIKVGDTVYNVIRNSDSKISKDDFYVESINFSYCAEIDFGECSVILYTNICPDNVYFNEEDFYYYTTDSIDKYIDKMIITRVMVIY